MDILSLLVTLAPEAEKVLRQAKTRKTDEQQLILLAMIYESHKELSKQMQNVTEMLKENETRMDILLERGRKGV